MAPVPEQDLEVFTDKTMISGIVGLHPAEIEGYYVFAVKDNGEYKMASNVCCMHHGGHFLMDAAQAELQSGPPCTGPEG